MAIIQSVREIAPKIHKTCFLAQNAVVVGDVILDENCTVWFNAVIRGDVNAIQIGKNTNIQDGAIIHCTYQKAKTVIGNNVSVGHAAIIHGCSIEDNTLIGMGAIIMDHAHVGTGSIVAAGAVVLEGTKIEPKSVYAGVPAKKIKDVDADIEELIKGTAHRYPMYASWFKQPPQ